MGDETAPIDQISFLARSAARVRILEHLTDAGPATQRDFRDHLDTSRSTVARSLSALEERDWVAEESGSYRLTPVGELVIGDFLDLIDTVEATDELSPFLRWFPLSEYDLDLAQLRDAEITPSTEGDPYAPARTQTELLRTAGRFRGFLPSIDLEGTKLVHEQIMAGELEAEIVVSSSVEQTIRSGEFAPLFRETIRDGGHTVSVADSDLPFYLGLADDGVVQVGVEDDEGFPRALLESSGDPIREWAECVYEDHRGDARTVSLDEFD